MTTEEFEEFGLYHLTQIQRELQSLGEAAQEQDTILREHREELELPRILRPILVDRFDLEELRTLCFDLGVDYDSLRGEGKEAKARELVGYIERRGRLDELETRIKQLRPGSIGALKHS